VSRWVSTPPVTSTTAPNGSLGWPGRLGWSVLGRRDLGSCVIVGVSVLYSRVTGERASTSRATDNTVMGTCWHRLLLGHGHVRWVHRRAPQRHVRRIGTRTPRSAERRVRTTAAGPPDILTAERDAARARQLTRAFLAAAAFAREGDSYLLTASQNLRVSASCSYLDTRSSVRVHICTNFASTTPLTP
jgi:hypothetical protein